MNTLPRPNYRTFGSNEHIRGRCDSIQVWPVTGTHDGYIIEFNRHFLFEHVRRDFHNTGPSPTIPQLCEGPSHYIWHLICGSNWFSGLRHMCHRFCRIKIRPHMSQMTSVSHRQNQHGHTLTESLCYTAIGIFRSGSMLHGKDPYFFA